MPSSQLRIMNCIDAGFRLKSWTMFATIEAPASRRASRYTAAVSPVARPGAMVAMYATNPFLHGDGSDGTERAQSALRHGEGGAAGGRDGGGGRRRRRSGARRRDH